MKFMYVLRSWHWDNNPNSSDQPTDPKHQTWLDFLQFKSVWYALHTDKLAAVHFVCLQGKNCWDAITRASRSVWTIWVAFITLVEPWNRKVLWGVWLMDARSMIHQVCPGIEVQLTCRWLYPIYVMICVCMGLQSFLKVVCSEQWQFCATLACGVLYQQQRSN